MPNVKLLGSEDYTMFRYRPNEAITYFFFHGTASLDQSDFTISLYKDGTASTRDVRVEHVGNGNYTGTFTPNEDGLWCLQIYQTSASTTKYEGSWYVNTALLSNLDYIRVTLVRIDDAIRRFFTNLGTLR